MFDISTLALKTDTVDVQLRHPATGELLFSDEAKTLPVAVTVYGKASSQYRNAVNAMVNRSMKRKAKKEKETAEVMNEEGLTLLTAITAGFKELSVNGSVPSSEADYRTLYADAKYAWIKDQVNEFVGDDANFLGQ